MAFTNKFMAGIAGGQLWANLLTLYEYMEPLENSYQSEWRIVHPDPVYGYGKTKKDIIENVSPPKGWAQFIHVLKVAPQDIAEFVCPTGKDVNLRNSLPQDFMGKPISMY